MPFRTRELLERGKSRHSEIERPDVLGEGTRHGSEAHDRAGRDRAAVQHAAVAVLTGRALEEPTRKALTARSRDGACPGCGAVLPECEGPKHAYLGASAACWDLYQRLARPTSEANATRSRRLVQDAYAAQHPGVPQRRSVQSVAVHLMDLCLLLERDGRIRRPAAVLGRMPRRRALDLHWLEPPAVRGTMTVADALQPDAGERRAACVEAWAREVWAAWEPHHPTVRRWLDSLPAQRADGGGEREL